MTAFKRNLMLSEVDAGNGRMGELAGPPDVSPSTIRPPGTVAGRPDQALGMVAPPPIPDRQRSNDMIGLIGREWIREGLVRSAESVREIGIESPRIARAALNPHAGENGLLGEEEDRALEPAVEGHEAVPPGELRRRLSLYHDQSHTAAKTFDFHGTVSSMLGLPVMRTFVDHRTAFDVAGRWVADGMGRWRS